MYRVKLAELIQKQFGSNLVNGVVSKVGPDHNPTITVFYELPDGTNHVLKGYAGENQKIVLERLAEKIYTELTA